MEKILACPMCHSKLTNLSCLSCGINYQVNNGIPSFICREMYSSDEAYADALRIIEFWGKGWEKRFTEPDHKPLFECDSEKLKSYAEADMAVHKASDSVMGVDMPMALLKDKVVLNIGCGAGTEALLLSYSGAFAIAMDITSQAPQAAEYLMHKVGGKGFGIQADARFLPLEESSVDVVYSSGVLHHSPNIEQSIAEVYRVLKPGGKAYIMLYATWSILFVQMRIKFSMGETAWETEYRKNPCTTTYTKRECERMFSRFTNVRVRKTGEALRHLWLIGKFMPTSLDHLLGPYLGPRLNIVVEKPNP